MAINDVKKVYQEIINDVCTAVREALFEERYDDHTLQELRTLWLARLENSRALEPLPTSIVDQATNREFRHPTTTGESNTSSSASSLNTKQSSGIKSTNNRLHQASNVAVTNYNPTFTTSVNTNSGILSATNPGVTQFVRPTFPTRPTNPTHLVNAAMKTSNQVDGTYDEICSEDSTMKKTTTTKRRKKKTKMIEVFVQVDGTGPPVGDDEDDDDDSELEGQDVGDELDDDDDDDGNEEGKDDPNPLCSDDDFTDDDEPSELFDTDNVVVCQYDKISRTKNKWRFILKSGVMNLEGRDYVFSKATGEADW